MNNPKKLIRSKMISKLKHSEWHTIDDREELTRLYMMKLKEEMLEIQHSDFKDIYEYADLFEVLIGLLKVNGFSTVQLWKAVDEKREKRGEFENIVLTKLNPDNPSDRIYFDNW